MNAYKITYKTYRYGTITKVAIIIAEDRGEAIEILKKEPVFSDDPNAVVSWIEEVDITRPGCLLIK